MKVMFKSERHQALNAAEAAERKKQNEQAMHRALMTPPPARPMNIWRKMLRAVLSLC